MKNYNHVMLRMSWLVLMLMSTLISAQEDQVLLKSGDVITGEILEGPSYIDEVRMRLKDRVSRYGPAEVQEFTMDGLLFISLVNPISGKDEFRKVLSYGKIVLTEGQTYIHMDPSNVEGLYKTDVYFIVHNGVVKALEKKFIKRGSKLVPVNDYVMVLKQLFIDDYSLVRDVDRTQYSSAGLIRLAEKYNASYPEVPQRRIETSNMKSNWWADLTLHNNGLEPTLERIMRGSGLGAVEVSGRYERNVGRGVRTSAGIGMVYMNGSSIKNFTLFDTRYRHKMVSGTLNGRLTGLLGYSKFKPLLFAEIKALVPFQKDFSVERLFNTDVVDGYDIGINAKVILGYSMGIGFRMEERAELRLSHTAFSIITQPHTEAFDFFWQPISLAFSYKIADNN